MDLATRSPAFAQAPPQRKARRPGRAARALVAPLHWDVIRIALGFLTLLTISRIQEEIPLVAVFRPGPLLTALCIALAVAKPKTVHWKDITATSSTKRILLMFLLMTILAPMGLSFGASATYILNRFLSTMIFFALIVIAIRDVADLRFIIGSYVVSMVILIYSGFFLWEHTTFNGFERVGSAGMYDANDLAPIFGFGLPMALLLAQTSGRWGRWLGYGAALGTPALIAITGSRGGFLALIATSLGLLVMVPGLSVFKRLGIVVVGVVAMAVVAPAGYMQKMGTIFDSQNDYNFVDETGRVAIWKKGMGFVRQHPLTGIGIGNFTRAQWMNPTFTETGAQVATMAPHNTFLEIVSELGIPTFIVFLSVVITGLSVAFMRRKLPKRWLNETAERRFLYLACSYIPVSFAGWSVGAFFVSHAYLAPFYLLASFLGAFFVLLKREKKLMRQEQIAAAVQRAG